MVIQIYNKFGGFLLLYSIIYNLSLEMSDEPPFLHHPADGEDEHIVLRELLAPYVEGVEGIRTVGTMLEQVFLRFGQLLARLVLVEAVATSRHTGRLNGE